MPLSVHTRTSILCAAIDHTLNFLSELNHDILLTIFILFYHFASCGHQLAEGQAVPVFPAHPSCRIPA